MNTSYVDNPQKDYEKLLKLKNQIGGLERLRSQINREVSYMGIIRDIVQGFINQLRAMGFNIRELPLSHDLGHMVYDTKSALLLMNDSEIRDHVTNPDLIAGIIGGIFHEFGLLLADKPEFCKEKFDFIAVPRYEEAQKLLRHAESGAFLAEKLLSNVSLKLDFATEAYIKTMIVYVIAAHTNYKRLEVQGFTIEPYKDTWSNGLPIYPVMITRWCDRMDLVGPHYIIRHFCTLAPEIHTHLTIKDGKQQFREISLESSMDLTLSGNMRDHVLMYKNSQSSESPYGKHDLPGIMINYREHQKQKALDCLCILDHPIKKLGREMTKEKLFQLIKDASMSNEDDKINNLVEKFFNLPEDMRLPWQNLFAKAKELMENPEFPLEKEALAFAKEILLV